MYLPANVCLSMAEIKILTKRLTFQFKKHCRMTMELLETEEVPACDVDQKAKYSAYVSKFLKPDHTMSENMRTTMGAKPVFLARNILKWKKKNLLEWISDNAKNGTLVVRGITPPAQPEPMDIDPSTELKRKDSVPVPTSVAVEGLGFPPAIKQEPVPMDCEKTPETTEPDVIVTSKGKRKPMVIKGEDTGYV